MADEMDAVEPPHDREGTDEPADRDERWVRSLQRMFRRVIEDERRGGVTIVKKIDAALRGERILK